MHTLQSFINQIKKNSNINTTDYKLLQSTARKLFYVKITCSLIVYLHCKNVHFDTIYFTENQKHVSVKKSIEREKIYQNQIYRSKWYCVLKYLATTLTDCKMYNMNYVVITLFIDAVKMQTLQSFFNKKTLSWRNNKKS